MSRLGDSHLHLRCAAQLHTCPGGRCQGAQVSRPVGALGMTTLRGALARGATITMSFRASPRLFLGRERNPLAASFFAPSGGNPTGALALTTGH